MGNQFSGRPSTCTFNPPITSTYKQGGMCFVTVEDGTGLVEATLFPKIYQRVGGLLQGRGPFVFIGRVEERVGGALGLRVDHLELAQQTA